MKRLCSLLFLLSVAFSALAQKTYVTVLADLTNSNSIVYLSGDVPASMSPVSDGSNYGKSYMEKGSLFVGDVLNQLAENGFAVEKMNTVSHNDRIFITYLLSKSTSTPEPGPADEVGSVKASKAQKVTEVARYNLQGMPVKKDEKGLQIIVYSNFTTKTVVVQ